MQPRQASNLQHFFCLSLLNAEITGVHHHPQLLPYTSNHLQNTYKRNTMKMSCKQLLCCITQRIVKRKTCVFRISTTFFLSNFTLQLVEAHLSSFKPRRQLMEEFREARYSGKQMMIRNGKRNWLDIRYQGSVNQQFPSFLLFFFFVLYMGTQNLHIKLHPQLFFSFILKWSC